MEVGLRLAAFTVILSAMATLEYFIPRRQSSQPKSKRWQTNLGLFLLNIFVLRLIFPLAGSGIAILAASENIGLLNILNPPGWISIVLTLIVLDLVIYIQHVTFHKIPWLWRVHRAHHMDLDIDVTTGLRFHPLEILFSMMLKTAVILLLGAPVYGVMLFEIMLNAGSLFSHSNFKLPGFLDRILRSLIVTPDMHRIHHSVHRKETDSNYGTIFSLWDRLFGNYREQPVDGHLDMIIGLEKPREPENCTPLAVLLKSPFISF
jgi:sterol desaturase/sphingolipid hydroxylase (fatty acid hydroxylase superfamily)